MNQEQRRSLSYGEAIQLIKNDFNAQKRGYIKELCLNKNLTYHTVIGLLNDTLNFEAPELILDLLDALGYDVRMSVETVLNTKRGDEKWLKSTTYYLKKTKSGKKTGSGNSQSDTGFSDSDQMDNSENDEFKSHQESAGKVAKRNRQATYQAASFGPAEARQSN